MRWYQRKNGRFGRCPLNTKDYEQFVADSRVITEGNQAVNTLEYGALGLAGETGEVVDNIKRLLRGDYSKEELRPEILKELGDTLWYLTDLTIKLDSSLEEIMQINYDKVQDRKQRGVQLGKGNHR